LVEHWSPKPGVGRSSRSSRAKRNPLKRRVSFFYKIGMSVLIRYFTNEQILYRELLHF